ncbi:MAG: hypothetical protein ABJG15_01885 [Hyphomonadaceae bacterium]
MNTPSTNEVWVFNGRHGYFPSGVFADRNTAEQWISEYDLSGTLTKYPVGIPVYDWALSNAYFEPSKAEHTTARFIGKFSCAQLEHYHYGEED